MPDERRIREAIDIFMARVRHDVDAHVQTLTSDVLRLVQDREDTWRSEMERAVGEARAGAEAAFRTRVETLRGELTREMEVRLAAERADVHAMQDAMRSGMRDSRIETLARLLGSVRRLDEASTLTGILETLAKGAAAETSRIAILLVDSELLRPWGHFGFSVADAPVELRVTQAPFLAAAVALKQTSFVPPAVDGQDASSPAFMRVPVGHTGLVVPIVVGAEVVAVLYADDVERLPEQEDAPVWTEEVELLVRHASLRLENVTSMQTVELLTKAT